MEKMKNLAKIRSSTLLIRLALLGIAIVVTFFSSSIISEIFSHWGEDSPEVAGWKFPVIIVIVASVITFFVALIQIWKLLGLIDRNKAFSQASVHAMRNVKYCGFIISGLFAIWLPLVFYFANEDDAPGVLLLFGTIFVGVPFVVAVLAGVAQKLFQNAIDIKKENDLTV